MRISKEYMERMQKQIALDCNLEEAVRLKDDVFLAPTAVLEGARIMEKMDMFFRTVVFMGKAYVMADPQILPQVEEMIKGNPAEWFFNFKRLKGIDRLLNEYGREIVDTHVYFLPDGDMPRIQIPEDFVWYSPEDIEKMKKDNEFHAALCYSATQPDVIAVGAPVSEEILKGDNRINQKFLKGMAGASLDGKYTKQIGINVRPEYAGEGLAVKLVTSIKQQLLDQGDLPFYGTNESHAVSRSVGTKAGFLPAFAELFVAKQEDALSKIYNNWTED